MSATESEIKTKTFYERIAREGRLSKIPIHKRINFVKVILFIKQTIKNPRPEALGCG